MQLLRFFFFSLALLSVSCVFGQKKIGEISWINLPLVLDPFEASKVFDNNDPEGKIERPEGEIDRILADPTQFVVCLESGFSLLPIWTSNGHVGFINEKSQIVRFPEFDDAIPEAATGLNWVKKQQKYAILRADGKLLTEFIFDSAYEFKDGFSVVKQGKGYGVVDMNGRWVIPPLLENVDKFVREGTLAYQKNQRWNFYKLDGKNLLTDSYDEVTGFHGGRAIVRNSKMCAVVDSSGSFITDFIFDNAQMPRESLIPVCMNNKWGYANLLGKIVIDCSFDFVDPFSGGKAFVLKDNRWILIMPCGCPIDNCACPTSDRRAENAGRNDGTGEKIDDGSAMP